MNRCVTGSNAGTPLATKFSPMPRPMTSGLAMRVTTMRSGSLASNTSSAYAPTKRCTARRTRLEQVVALLQVVVHEVRGDLGVGLGLELVALGDELGLERLVVLDDAVVDDGDAVAGQMRVRVRFGHAAVRGPARVRDAEPARERLRGELRLELRDFAYGAAQAELVIRLHDGEAGRVVAAILEALQALDEHGNDVALCDCSDDAAHSLMCPYLRLCALWVFSSAAANPES